MVHSAHSPALPLVRGLLLPRWLAIGRVCSRLTHARSRGSPRDAARSFLPRAAPHSCQQHGAPSIPIIMEMITQAHTGPRHRPGDAGFLLWCPFYCGVMVGVGVAREAADLARRATGFPGDRLSGPQGMPGFFSADRQDIQLRSSHFTPNRGNCQGRRKFRQDQWDWRHRPYLQV
jgi:hypothetical protein